MSDAVPLFVYTGVTCERFQIYGSCPHCNDWLHNNVRGETRHWETLRKILGATPSGPLGLVLFSISNWSFTSCSVINHSGQILSRGRSLFGRFSSFSIFEISAKYLGTDHLTWRRGSYRFLFRSEIFFRTTRVRIFFFFQNSTLGYIAKTLNQIIFFPQPKSEYFFQQHWDSEYFLGKKNHNPLKLNGRSHIKNIPFLWGMNYYSTFMLYRGRNFITPV